MSAVVNILTWHMKAQDGQTYEQVDVNLYGMKGCTDGPTNQTFGKIVRKVAHNFLI